jgi:predicted RNA-binding Zn-ribbon protein involved in translation (DUF1610 family)
MDYGRIQTDTPPVLAKEDLQSPDFLELEESIKKDGLLMPLSVEKGIADQYNVIAGRRRFTALQHIAGKKNVEIPCSVYTDLEAIDELSLSANENDKRSNMGPAVWKEVIAKYKHMGLKQAEIGKRLHRTPAWVSMAAKGRPWNELKKEQEAKRAGTDVKSKEVRETFECPGCGVKIVRRTGSEDLELGQVAYDLADQDNTSKPASGKRRPSKGGKREEPAEESA